MKFLKKVNYKIVGIILIIVLRKIEKIPQDHRTLCHKT